MGDLGRETIQRPPGGQRLQRLGLREIAGRRHPGSEVHADQRVAELAGGTGRAPVDAAIEHQPAADPGADGEHDQVLHDRPAGVVERLRERRHRGVVVHEHRQPETLREHHAKVDVVEREVGAGADPPGGELDHRRHPHADRDRARAAHLVDARDDLVDQPLGARHLGRPDERVAQPGVLQRRNSHLRAAHVDADQLAIEHRRSIYLACTRRYRGARTRDEQVGRRPTE